MCNASLYRSDQGFWNDPAQGLRPGVSERALAAVAGDFAHQPGYQVAGKTRHQRAMQADGDIVGNLEMRDARLNLFPNQLLLG